MFKIEVYKEKFKESFDPLIELELIANGFRFIEGPAWDHVEQELYFSDIMGNAIYKYKDKKVQLFRQNSYLANGNTLDNQGNLITCEHGTSRVTITDRDGSYKVLVNSFQGKALNSPNDVVCNSKGQLYFTDPNPGRMARVGIPREQELPYQGVYLLDKDLKEIKLLDDQLILPNGLCLSQDEKKLYVNDSRKQVIYVHDVKEDGLVENKEVFAELKLDGLGCADGLKFGGDGLLYCSAPGGIQVFDQTGDLVGRIYTPEVTANFTWGDSDMKSIYLTATSGLYRLRTKIPGHKLY